ncbi:MAG: nucleoside deaminase [Chloroflexi bacterium]|uniref:nucleoside deaminase n=1 Tax=Candidatus Flexifilum breve TaxID=3140694 RepID=UPI00313553FA|nr:nucleoside deaminase [Chloroflexota bacterium]
MSISETDRALLRRAIALAATAREHGNHPFGALLADADGNILVEAENTVITERDLTGHAETNLIRAGSRQLAPDVLAAATLYTSTEPCAMCAGAIYWSGISRVIFGLSAARLTQLVDGTTEKTLSLTAERVLNSGGRPVAVIGPVLEEEALAVHLGFWKQ